MTAAAERESGGLAESAAVVGEQRVVPEVEVDGMKLCVPPLQLPEQTSLVEWRLWKAESGVE